MVIYTRKLYNQVRAHETGAQKLVEKILKDTETLAKHSMDVDEWLTRLGSSITVIKYEEHVERLAESIARASGATTTMPPGAQLELVKSMIREDVKGYIEKLTDDLKVNLTEKLLEAYDAKKPPLELARELTREVEGLAAHRARTIARTETMRASNLAEYVRGVYVKGFQAYRVTSAVDCCEECAETYQYGEAIFGADETDLMPPLHPNCRCTLLWLPLTETPEEFLNEPVTPNPLIDLLGVEV